MEIQQEYELLLLVISIFCYKIVISIHLLDCCIRIESRTNKISLFILHSKCENEKRCDEQLLLNEPIIFASKACRNNFPFLAKAPECAT